MTCQEVVAVLADYLEATLSPDLATYRQTKSVAAAASRVEMPEEMKARLRDFLLRELQEGR